MAKVTRLLAHLALPLFVSSFRKEDKKLASFVLSRKETFRQKSNCFAVGNWTKNVCVSTRSWLLRLALIIGHFLRQNTILYFCVETTLSPRNYFVCKNPSALILWQFFKSCISFRFSFWSGCAYCRAGHDRRAPS